VADVVLCERMVFKTGFKIRKLGVRMELGIRSLERGGNFERDTESRAP